MIVRIFGDDQYDVPDAALPRMNELDNACVAAVAEDDEARFHACYGELLGLVRSEGKAVDDDHLGSSDLMLPPEDISMDEAREEFTGEGLIPD